MTTKNNTGNDDNKDDNNDDNNASLLSLECRTQK